MTVNFQFTLDDYRNAYRTHYRKGASAFTRWMMKLSLVIGVLLLLASVLIVVTRQGPLNAAFSPLVVGAFWTWIGTGQIYSLSARNQFAKSPALRDPRRVEFSEDGVTTDAGIASSQVSWKAYLRYAESKDTFLLYTSPACFVIVPKRVLQPEQVTELRGTHPDSYWQGCCGSGGLNLLCQKLCHRRNFANSGACTFPVSSLPPIPIQPDDECQWLMMHGTEHVRGLDQYEHNLQPAAVLILAQEADVRLPESFRRFMSTPELQRRVRSSTDCYLDPGERIVKTVGAMPGHLIHFLSDSQSCVHWYLHATSDGSSAILVSEDLYCYRVTDPEWEAYPTCSLEEVDLQEQEFACCASSFSEFLYRFWIENEIWFALAHKESRRPLKPLELAYVSHYLSNT